MWKPEHRLAADRRAFVTREWAIVAPMIPPGRHGGRRRSVNVREVLNGIFYVLWTGCQWKALPKDLPPKGTVHVSSSGTGTAPWSASITRCTWRSARRRDVKQARRWGLQGCVAYCFFCAPALDAGLADATGGPSALSGSRFQTWLRPNSEMPR